MFARIPRPLAACAAFTAIALASAACSSEEKGGGGGGGTTTTFLGIVSSDDASESGSVSVTVSTANPSAPSPTGVAIVSVAANGSLKIVGGATSTLTGTYDDATGALDVSGGGYTLTGFFDGSNRLEGTYTGPSTQGTFVTAKSDANTSAYCGTYAGDDQGLWDFVIDGTTLLGQAVSSATGGSTPLDGSISGNNITILFPGTQTVLATGTRSGNNVSGTWADPNSSDTGTWTGTVCP